MEFLDRLRAMVWVAGLVCSASLQAELSIGDPAPDLLGRTVDDTEVLVSQAQGKVVVVTFWASWCGPCRKELPIVEALARAAKAKNVEVEVVAVNIEDRRTFRRLVDQLKEFQMTLANDPRGHVSDRYGVNGIPHIAIIGRDGKLLRVFRGYSEEQFNDVIGEMNTALLSASTAPIETQSDDPTKGSEPGGDNPESSSALDASDA